MRAAYAELGLIGRRQGWPIDWAQSVWGRLSPTEKSQGSTLQIEWEEGEELRGFCFGRDDGDPVDVIPGVSTTFRFVLVGHGSYGRQSFAGSIWPSPEGAFLLLGVHAQSEELQEDWFELVAQLSLQWFFDEKVEFLTFGFEDELGTYNNPGIFCVYPSSKEIPAGHADLEKHGMVVELGRDAMVVWAQTSRAFLERRALPEEVLRLMDQLRENGT